VSTLIVNLFAGPGAGKSTMMAGVFTRLKTAGVCAEMAAEFAKDLCWEKRYSAMSCQPYVFGEQLFRIQRLINAEVPVVITDSPLLLSTVYGRNDMPPSFRDAVRSIHAGFNNLNVFVHRTKPYDPRGRRQSEASAKLVDQDILAAIDGVDSFVHVAGDVSGAAVVTQWVMDRL
jgi:hypothetical protein